MSTRLLEDCLWGCVSKGKQVIEDGFVHFNHGIVDADCAVVDMKGNNIIISRILPMLFIYFKV